MPLQVLKDKYRWEPGPGRPNTGVICEEVLVDVVERDKRELELGHLKSQARFCK